MKFNNEDEEHLILNDGYEITILTEIERGGYYKKFKMKKLTKYQIIDFRIYEDTKLIILDSKGRIVIYELFFFDLRYDEISHLQLGLDKNEMTTSLALCPRDKFMAVSINVEGTFKQNWLVLLQLEHNGDDTQMLLKDIK